MWQRACDARRAFRHGRGQVHFTGARRAPVLFGYFESIATGLMSQLEQALTITQKNVEGNILEQTCDCFFEKYLMDHHFTTFENKITHKAYFVVL